MTPQERLKSEPYSSWKKKLRHFKNTPLFEKLFACVSLGILLTTVLLWAILGANVQQGNADQLINAYLFENDTTLQGAVFPGQHSFFLKWPLFMLIKWLGYSHFAYICVTVTLTLLTVGALAFILYRIIRKPLVFGLLCLALASILLAIPAQPYAGAILPVNMAMITTRNIEYIIYLGSLILLTQTSKIAAKDWRFWLSAVLLTLVIASDKLFLPLSLGGAVIALILYGLWRNRHMVRFAARWFWATVIATGFSYGLLWVLDRFVTNIVGADSTTPYGLTPSLHGLLLGSVYALLHLFTNFGANLSFDATQLQQIPARFAARLLSIEGIAWAINMLTAIVGLYAVRKLIRQSFIKKRLTEYVPSASTQLAIALIATTVVAMGLFIATNHYYPVDARYLTVGLFALTIALAVFVRHQEWAVKKVLLIACLLLIGVAAGVFTSLHTYQDEMVATATQRYRNTVIAAAMKQHSSEVLLGDYWRVLPVKQEGGNIHVLPLGDCFNPRAVLASSAWQPDLKTQGFAYLLSVDNHSPDFPSCTLDEVVAHYGRPNASTIIAGTLDDPQEIVLFYDHGAHPTEMNLRLPSTIIPITLNDLPKPSCTGKVIVTTVAHQDDDILFMNPDHLHELQTGACLTTIYITAGDAGSNPLYWLSREKGSKEAYDLMGDPDKTQWIDRIVKLANDQYITVATSRNNPQMTLIFMHLPDGNANGSGFKATRFESLARLEQGKIPEVHTVDEQSSYTKDSLINALEQLLTFYQPQEIHTQAPTNMNEKYPDHSDHMAVGRYTTTAYHAFQANTQSAATLTYYIGYPIHAQPPNVTEQAYHDKAQLFFMYSRFDAGGCTSFALCANKSVYGEYLKRQYKYSP